ncbi:glycoside hydrolase family 18 protein [Caproicibacter sp.]|uniref:glycoside hydrolase family 18 protein n=1 Tax=Caproicibacter sp. TaxID=2814884 RepID=UPI0039895456
MSIINAAKEAPPGKTISPASSSPAISVSQSESKPFSSVASSAASSSYKSAISSVATSASASSSTASSASSSASAVVPLPFLHPARIMVGYYGGWAAYSGFTPDKVNASGLTVLNYAFAMIGTDLKIAVSDDNIDYSNFNKLRTLKKSYPSLRTVISVGGWDDSKRFSDMALTDVSRTAFADSVVGFIKANGFDGVDIDWEYPTGGGLCTNVSRPEDKTNFGLLLKTLREKLDRQGIADHKHYILSFAGEASGSYAAGIDISNIALYVDYGTIMAYDIHGNWDTYTDFNAPLTIPFGPSPQDKSSVDGAVRSWLNHGFPAKKMVMGVPFYGYVYQGVPNVNNGLWQHFASGVAIGYDAIQSKYAGNTSFRKFYDATAMVPYLFNGSTFISYEDASSIQRKTQYAVSKNLLGVGAWELSFDRSGTLLRMVQTALG